MQVAQLERVTLSVVSLLIERETSTGGTGLMSTANLSLFGDGRVKMDTHSDRITACICECDCKSEHARSYETQFINCITLSKEAKMYPFKLVKIMLRVRIELTPR